MRKVKYKAIAYILLGIAGLAIITSVPFMVSYYQAYTNYPVESTERDVYRVFYNGDWQYQHTVNDDTTVQDFENYNWGSVYQPFMATLMILSMTLGILTGVILFFSDLDDRIRITGGIISLVGGALGFTGSLSWISFGKYIVESGFSPQQDYFFVGFYLAIAFSFTYLVVGLVYTITSIVRLIRNPNFYVRTPKIKKVTRFDDGFGPTYPDTTASYGKQFGRYVSIEQVQTKPQEFVPSRSTQQYQFGKGSRVQVEIPSFIKRLSIIFSAIAASNYLLLMIIPFMIYKDDESSTYVYIVRIFLDGRIQMIDILDGVKDVEFGHMANLFTDGYPTYITVLAIVGLTIVMLAFIQKIFVYTRASQIYTNSMIIGGSALGLFSLLGYMRYGNQVITDLYISVDDKATYSAGMYINCLLFAIYLGVGIYLFIKITPKDSTKSRGSEYIPQMIEHDLYESDSAIGEVLDGDSYNFEESAKALKTPDIIYQRQSQIAIIKELVGDKDEVDINLLNMVSQISISTIKEIGVEDLKMIVKDGKLITQQRQNEINAAKKAAKKAAAAKKKKTTAKK